MRQSLPDALAAVRDLLIDVDALVRAVGAGRRRNTVTAHQRVEVRPVDLKGGRRLQVVTTGERGPRTRNHEPGPDAEQAVDALLAEPFSAWHVETLERVVQLRVTRRGEALVHVARTARRDVAPSRHDRVRRHLLPPDDPLFGAVGADADKRRQVDAFLRHLAPLLRDRQAPADGRPLAVVDLGCGNAYLTFAAHRWLGTEGVEARTLGVDVRADLLERNRELAERLGMPGLTFEAGTIADAPDPGRVDLVLALHACDTATDEALARAVRWRAGAVLAAPCCHHDLQRRLAVARAGGRDAPHPYQGLVRHPILRERFADVLTDALRAQVLRLLGYRVEVVEFIDSRHTPRNSLIRAVRTGSGPPPGQVREYRDLVDAWQVRPVLADLLAPELAEVLAGGDGG